jgi:hypothetical protein
MHIYVQFMKFLLLMNIIIFIHELCGPLAVAKFTIDNDYSAHNFEVFTFSASIKST